MVVFKSVMKTVAIMVIRIIRNDAWDDYRISKVQSKRRHWYDCDQVESFIRIMDIFIHNIINLGEKEGKIH